MERDSRSSEGHAEQLPVEVIGDILSRVRAARDVIKASLTCKEWREAYREHLHALSFDVADFKFPKGRDSVPGVELSITKAIFQTSGLRKLSVRMDFRYTFSAGFVVACLMSVRETLSELFYEVRTSTSVNVLDIFERQKLESLSLFNYKIGSGELNFQRFPCLTSLSLSRVGISVEDLNRLLNDLPKLESLKLKAPFLEKVSDDEFFSPEKVVKVHIPTLKALFLDNVKLFQFILENSSIEYLQVEWCNFSSFKVYGSKALRDFKFLCSEAWLLEIDETNNLESFEIMASTITKSNLFPMMIQAPKLKRFRFWVFDGEYLSPVRGNERTPDDGSGIVLDLERMAICSPQLRHLAIFCDEGLDGIVYRFGGSTPLEKVAVLEIGWDGFDGFADWAEKLLKCCPNVKKVIVHWVIPKNFKAGRLKGLTKQSSSIIEMVGKYQHRQMQLAFIYDSHYIQKNRDSDSDSD